MLSTFSPTQRWLIHYAIVAWILLGGARVVRRLRISREGRAGVHIDPADLPMPVWERVLVLTIYAVILYFVVGLVPREIVPAIRGDAGEYPQRLVVLIGCGAFLVPMTLLLALRSWHAVNGHRARVFGRHSLL
jgi:hypothetical protein